MTKRPSVKAMATRYVVGSYGDGWCVLDTKKGEVLQTCRKKRHAVMLCGIIRMGEFK